MIIVKDIEQNTEAWFQAKLGVPSASNFDKIVTTKGVPSTSRKKYMYTLAAQRITGKNEDGYQNAAMQRGIELEPEARGMYELMTDKEVETVGFCFTDERRQSGCSPDGLIGTDGLLEIKCPSSAVHIEYLLKGMLPTAYYQQVQGQLLVTDRKYADFFSYFPAIKPLLITVKRDEDFIASLRVQLEMFSSELNDIIEKLRSSKWTTS